LAFGADGQSSATYAIANTYDTNVVPLSARIYHVLRKSRNDRSLQETLTWSNDNNEDNDALADELWSLWEQRVVILRPVARAARRSAILGIAAGVAVQSGLGNDVHPASPLRT
jgi:hypothetical protein